MNARKELKKLGDELALVLQETILKKGLVKSGKLLKSIKVTTTDSTVKVGAVDYFKYVNGRFEVVAAAKKTKRYKDIIAAFKTVIGKRIKEEFKK